MGAAHGGRSSQPTARHRVTLRRPSRATTGSNERVISAEGAGRLRLSGATAFAVPRALLEDTDAILREAGTDRLEAFVVWSGAIEGTAFVARNLHVPEQRSARDGEGLHVTITGAALHQLSTWLEAHGEIIGVQVHSHPQEAYHSEADDALAVATKRGALSIVVPRFGEQGVTGPGSVGHRLDASGWIALDSHTFRALMRVE